MVSFLPRSSIFPNSYFNLKPTYIGLFLVLKNIKYFPTSEHNQLLALKALSTHDCACTCACLCIHTHFHNEHAHFYHHLIWSHLIVFFWWSTLGTMPSLSLPIWLSYSAFLFLTVSKICRIQALLSKELLNIHFYF